MADFTQIKLPTIYYHLEKMEADGLIDGIREKETGRPEKTVYTITEKGAMTFQSKLHDLMKFEYRPQFPSDGVFFFSDALDPKDILAHLEAYNKVLHKTNSAIVQHQNDTMQFVPDAVKTTAMIIFDHHLKHYQAELDWAEEALKNIKEAKQW